MNAPKEPFACTVAVIIPCNSFANRQRCMGFFRETAIDRRITAFFIDSSHFSPFWHEEFTELARQTRLQAIVATSYDAMHIKALIRKLHLKAKLLVFGDRKLPKSHPLYIDNEAIGRAAAEFLTARGYRHLAYVSGDFSGIENTHSCRRLDGFRCAARAAQAKVVGTFQLKPKRMASGTFKAFLNNLPKPCGIFTYNDSVGRDLLNFCRLNGIDVPDKVAVVGADNDEIFCEATVPTLSSVAIDFAAAGRIACRLILDGLAVCKQIAPPQQPKVYERDSTQSTKSHGRIVMLAQSLIHQREGRIRIAELAKLVHVTPRTLQLGFRNILGKRPKEVIIDYRLNRAKELLATTDRPIAEIADTAAFPALSDFCYRFSERYGLSPTEYRKQLLNG